MLRKKTGNLMRWNTPKYFKKLFFIYFIILLILVGIIAGTSTVYKNSNSEHDVFVDEIMQTEKFKKDTDIIFDTTEVIVNLMSEYEIIQKYAYQNTEIYQNRDFELLYDIIKTIRQLQTKFAGYNLSIALTKYTDDLVVSGYGTMETVDEFISENGIDMHKAIADMSCEDSNTGYKVMPAEELCDKVTVLYKRDMPNGSIVYYFLFFGNDDMWYMYDQRSDTHLIFDDYIDEYKEFVCSKVFENNQIKDIDYAKPSNNVSCFIAKSDMHDERIAYVKFFEEDSENIMVIMIPWIFMLILAALILAAILAKYSYMPIREILERFGVIDVDEFAAMGAMVDSVLKTNNDMQMSILQKNKILKNRFMLDVLNGYIREESMYKLSKENEVEFINGECHIILMEIENILIEDDFEVDGVAGMRSRVYDIIEDRLREFENTEVCVAQNERIAVISEYASNKLSDILAAVDEVRYKNDIGINIAVGTATGEKGELPKIYRHLSNGLDNKGLTRKKDIITLEEINSMDKGRLVYSAETEAMLIDYVVNGEKNKTIYCIKNIFNANADNVQTVFDDLKTSMIITIKRILAKIDANDAEIFEKGTDIQNELNAVSDKSEAFEMIKNIFERISDHVSAGIDLDNKTVGGEILEYIRENLSSDISISSVSEHFGISPSSISRILKEKYDLTFKSYIDAQRIKKAKEIMDSDKNILIKELAQMVGYNNAVSFIRMFKKSEGISPGQYIKMK